MMDYLKVIVLGVFIGSFVDALSANDHFNYRFEYITIENGLPQNNIQCIEKDAYGYMWFGTNNGVCRYDSYSFELFKSIEGNYNALPDNLISTIEASAKEGVWIGASKGLSYYSHSTGNITQFVDSNAWGKQINKVNDILSVNQNVWVATQNDGLYLIKKENGEFKIKAHYCLQNNNLGSNQVNTIFFTGKKELYIGTRSEAYLFNDTLNEFVPINTVVGLPAQTPVNDIFMDDAGYLYFASNNGLYVYSDSTGETDWYVQSFLNPEGLIHNWVNEVTQDLKGHVVLATLGGLQFFNPETGQFNNIGNEGPDNYTLNSSFINTVFSDDLGNVWVGTGIGGVNKFNVLQNTFNFFTSNPNDENSLNENTINSIYHDGEDLWIGTAGGGLNRYNEASGKFSHYSWIESDDLTISSNYVSALTKATDGNVWAGTWGGGLNIFKKENGKVRIERFVIGNPRFKNELVNPFISTLVSDSRGFLLVGTEGGLSVINLLEKKVTTYISPEGEMPPLEEIGCALLDSKDYFWVGTRNGIFRFPRASIRNTRDDVFVISQLEYYNHRLSDTTSLPGDYVISLMEDANGEIWIGTYGKGFAKAIVDKEGVLSFQNYSVVDGLSNNVIYGMQQDKKGRIWISTDYGLSLFNPENEHFRNFFKQDGLLNNQFYWSASHKDAGGRLYFGGVEGLHYFTPDNITEYTYSTQPKITKFRIVNDEVKPKELYHKVEVINRPIYASDTIYLSYKDNNFSFDFSAFDYYLPAKSTFKYKLSGVDKKFIEVSAQRRFANYNNLPGGTYQFQLKSSNCDGIWNEKPTIVTIIVKPPFYSTTWFRVLLGVVVLIIVVVGIRWQMYRIIQQKKVLEERVRIRTQKIEDQNVMLEKQADELLEINHQLEFRQKQIEQQKEELEAKNEEISKQRDEVVSLNEKVNEINQLQLRFFTNVSHEFRTPLTLIISPIERLVKQFENDEETGYLLKIINRNAQRLLMLIKQLLEIRKIETGNQNLQVELTDVKSYLLEVFHAFEDLAEKNNINYTAEINTQATAWIDKEKLENVLYNLLSNAFRFTPHGHAITLKANRIRNNNLDFIEIGVKDTGEGIPPHQMDKLYDRFLQVTESKKHMKAGTGIGLSMVKSLVKIMHGEITLKSELKKGSEFTVTLPVSKSVFAEDEIDTTGQVYESVLKDRVAVLVDQIIERPIQEFSPNDEGVEKVLVVEDNSDMRAFISNNLSQYFSVIEAENGQQGYELAKKETPEIIISDVMMPGMSGTELCKKIKSNLYTSHIPVVLLTARSKPEDQVEGIEVGADDYITKPFNTDVLVAKVKGIIENRTKLKMKFSKLEDVNPEEMVNSDLDNSFFVKANEVVDKYYTDPSFDVDQFASEMIVSRSQLYNKLKAITNLSANEFINTYRLKKAMEMLKGGQLQISEVAYATGFNDPKYFSRIFKKFYHSSPSEYIKKITPQ